MSFETTMANAAARDAEWAWKQHKKWCSNCSRYARMRQWDALCNAAAVAFADHQAAQRALARNRELDKLPNPDQAALFE